VLLTLSVEPRYSLINDPKFWDLEIVVHDQGEETSFKVHRSVVCAQSTFFDKACSGNFKEASTHSIKLHELDLPTMQDTIKYLYRGEIDMGDSQTLNCGKLQELLKAWNFLGMDAAQLDMLSKVNAKLVAFNTSSRGPPTTDVVSLVNEFFVYRVRDENNKTYYEDVARQLSHSMRFTSARDGIIKALTQCEDFHSQFLHQMVICLIKNR